MSEKEKRLWQALEEAENDLNNDELIYDQFDLHYLDGRLEGIEFALAEYYGVETIEELYKHKPGG